MPLHHRTGGIGKRLALTHQGKVRYKLKTTYRDGTTHVIFESLDFIARPAALVPKPKVNMTCYHGLFSPLCFGPCFCGLIAATE